MRFLEKGGPPLVEGGGNLRELPLFQEPQAPRLGDQVKGEGALGRGETRGVEDPTVMEPAGEGDLSNGSLPGEEPDIMGPSVADGEGAVAGRAFLLFRSVPERSEGTGLTRYEEKDAGGGVVDELDLARPEGHREALVLEEVHDLGKRPQGGHNGGDSPGDRLFQWEGADVRIDTEVLEDSLPRMSLLVPVGFTEVPVVLDRPSASLRDFAFR